MFHTHPFHVPRPSRPCRPWNSCFSPHDPGTIARDSPEAGSYLRDYKTPPPILLLPPSSSLLFHLFSNRLPPRTASSLHLPSYIVPVPTGHAQALLPTQTSTFPSIAMADIDPTTPKTSAKGGWSDAERVSSFPFHFFLSTPPFRISHSVYCLTCTNNILTHPGRPPRLIRRVQGRARLEDSNHSTRPHAKGLSTCLVKDEGRGEEGWTPCG